MYEVKGRNGTVRFDGAIVEIAREGAMARMRFGKGVKRIPVRSISAVQIKPPSAITTGFIAFSLSGASERNTTKGNRTLQASTDENSVLFSPAQLVAMQELASAVESAITATYGGPLGGSVKEDASPADRLRQLQELVDAGLLSEVEAAERKQQIIASI